ncbi:hypothetical protein SAMN04487950_3188 [Halogranum rubrum]|uniref:Uncharacterized protein n=1 Tax=Halogranum rubrum TaxID=553466 RepID=A0A1I4GC29_9EURY|nr:hypothetical protein [Halogranum rubrum]SFL27602.1 hypothetical protein SAMN04487950_3188 [Halogranum rubrum]
MTSSHERVSVLVALEFVVMGSILLFLIPLRDALPFVPLLLVLALALYKHYS